MVYGAETWSTTKSQEKRLDVNEMSMIQWMCGVTKKDGIRNEYVRAVMCEGNSKGGTRD